MKKLFLITALVLVLFPFCIQAQLFVGGDINFNTSGGKTETATTSYDMTKTLGIDFSPLGGYYLNEDLAAGVGLTLSIDRQMTPPLLADGDKTIDVSSTFGIMPFIRYHFIRFNKFSVYGQGQIGVSFGSQKTKVGSTETKGPKRTTIGFSLFPGISFDISDNLSLETSINAFGFGYSITTNNNENTNVKTTTSNGYFGVSLDNIKTLGSISVGAIYRF